MVVLSVAINPAYYNASLSNWGKSGANPAYENKAVSTWDIYNNQDEESTISPYQYHSGNDSSTGLNIGLNNASNLNSSKAASTTANTGLSSTKGQTEAAFYGGLLNASKAFGLSSLASAATLGLAAPSALSLGNVLGTAAKGAVPASMATLAGRTLDAAFNVGTKNPTTMQSIASFAVPTALSFMGLGPVAALGYSAFGGLLSEAIKDALNLRDEEQTLDAIEDAKGWVKAHQLMADWDSLYGPQMALSVQASLADRDAPQAAKDSNSISAGIPASFNPSTGYFGYTGPSALGYSVGLTGGQTIGPASFSKDSVTGVTSVQQANRDTSNLNSLASIDSGLSSYNSTNGSGAGGIGGYGGISASTESPDGTISGHAENDTLGQGAATDSLNGGGGGGGGGGNSVVCTELIKQGKYTKAAYRKAWKYVKRNKTKAQIRGYHWWGVPLVKKMQTGSRFYNMLGVIVGKYADELAYLEGADIKRTLIGRLVKPIINVGCEIIGRLVKYDKVNKRWDREDSDRLQVGN